jgi:hypothetical protein
MPVWLKIEPRLDTLRSDPHFPILLWGADWRIEHGQTMNNAVLSACDHTFKRILSFQTRLGCRAHDIVSRKKTKQL